MSPLHTGFTFNSAVCKKNMTFFNFTVENLLYVMFVLIIIQSQVKANKLNFNCVAFG